MKQVTLFGGKVLSQREKEIEQHNKRCAELRRERREKGENEMGILGNFSFPCKKALEYPVGEHRHHHIKYCDECKQLERELDLQLGVKNHIYS